jgi:hypothetical protein
LGQCQHAGLAGSRRRINLSFIAEMNRDGIARDDRMGVHRVVNR